MNKATNQSLLSSLSPENKEKLIELITEIRADVQYLILINAKHPSAKIVRQVRGILALLSVAKNQGNGE